MPFSSEDAAIGEDVWDQEQQRYWDDISADYDELYRNAWSARENEWVKQRLSFIRDIERPRVLDLGCGTGLGCRLVKEINPQAQYYGVDISKEMVDKFDGDSDGIVICSMENFSSRFEPNSFDVVISLFSSLSYASNTRAVFNEISQSLVDGGYAYLSVLSAGSFSRIRTGIASGRYRTRGDHSNQSVPVQMLSRKNLVDLAREADLHPREVSGMNLFSGFVEAPVLWELGRRGAQLLPNASHTIEALFQWGPRHA